MLISNKENELDELCFSTASQKGRSRKSFGKCLDSAMNELREENDLKLALKYQLHESGSYIKDKARDEKLYREGSETTLKVTERC